MVDIGAQEVFYIVLAVFGFLIILFLLKKLNNFCVAYNDDATMEGHVSAWVTEA